MKRPRLLDLFCGAGGAGMGYHRAGFDVTGVDIKPQKRYPFEFIQADALEYCQDHGHEYDAIHVSPPCQAFTDLKSMWNSKKHVDLLTPARSILKNTGRPYVIENVPGAPIRASLMLCGTMFGLGCDDAELWRHRYFEMNWEVTALCPPCNHYQRKKKVIGVYGGHGRDRRRVIAVYGHTGGSSQRDGTQQFSVEARRESMGIDWMTNEELSQAIPPAYTEFIGRELLNYIKEIA